MPHPVEKVESVPLEAYEEVLGRELSLDNRHETLPIDDTGYSFRAGNELGEDYLGDSIVIFDEEQLDGHDTDSYEVPEFILGALKDHEPFLELLDEYGPIGVTYDIGLLSDYRNGIFWVRTRYDPEHSSQAFREEYELRENLTWMNEDDLKDKEYIESLVDASDGEADTEKNVFRLPTHNSPFARSPSELKINGRDHTTFLFHTEKSRAYTVSIGTQDNPLEDETGGHWQEQTPTRLMEYLLENERITIDEVAILEEKNELAEDTLREFMTACSGRGEAYNHLATLNNLMEEDLGEYTPSEFNALDALRWEQDVSLERAGDWAKLDAITGNTPFYQDLIGALEQAHEDGTYSIWKHSKYEVSPDEIEDAYNSWNSGRPYSSPNIPFGGYGAETLQEFCETHNLGEFGGRFLSPLINNMLDEKIMLDDMSGVDFIGLRLSDKHVVINGDAGDWVGKEMRNGTIEVRGDAGRMVGTGATGGEIYLHGSGRPFESNADIYKKKWVRSLFSAEDKWKKIN